MMVLRSRVPSQCVPAYEDGYGRGLCIVVMGMAVKVRHEELLGFPWLGVGKSLQRCIAICPSSRQGQSCNREHKKIY